MNLEYEATLKVTKQCDRGVSHYDLHTARDVSFNLIDQMVVLGSG